MKPFPGPNAKRILADTKEFYATSTIDSRVVVVGGSGAIVRDADGFRFYDLHCGAGVTNLGHGEPPTSAAIRAQLDTGIIHAEHHNGPIPAAIEFAKILATQSPVKKPAKVFFSNSGTEANEAGWKLSKARLFHSGETRAERVLFCRNGFGGRTKGSLGATTSKPNTQQYPFLTPEDLANFQYISYPSWNNRRLLEEELGKLPHLDRFDRIMIELRCQGEGGIIIADESATRMLYEVTQDAGILWHTDAVQCGMGRTGALWGHDFSWLESDIMTLGKALGGGLPIGATVFRSGLDWNSGEHSNTFGGGPLVMASALAAFAEIKKIVASGTIHGLANLIHRQLNCFLEEFPVITDVRGIGMMWAVEFRTKEIRDTFVRTAEEMTATRNLGLRLLGAGEKSVRLMPPLNISLADLTRALFLFSLALKLLK